MVAEEVDPHDGAVEVRVGRLDRLEIQVPFVFERLETCPRGATEVSNAHGMAHSGGTFENKFEERVEVLWARGGYEDVGVAVRHSRCDANAQRSGLAPASCRGEGHGAPESLLTDCLGLGIACWKETWKGREKKWGAKRAQF